MSLIGTKRTYRVNSRMSACGGKRTSATEPNNRDLRVRRQLDVLKPQPCPCAGFQPGSTASFGDIFNSLN
jgi:hypothetical protein